MGDDCRRQTAHATDQGMQIGDQCDSPYRKSASDGRTEGFNRGLRTILWRACGMHNFDHFRLRVLHLFG